MVNKTTSFKKGKGKKGNFKKNVVHPRLNHALIIHANMHDQGQRLMGRYHNTTLDTNSNIKLYLQAKVMRTQIHKSAKAIISVY